MTKDRRTRRSLRPRRKHLPRPRPRHLPHLCRKPPRLRRRPKRLLCREPRLRRRWLLHQKRQPRPSLTRSPSKRPMLERPPDSLPCGVCDASSTCAGHVRRSRSASIEPMRRPQTLPSRRLLLRLRLHLRVKLPRGPSLRLVLRCSSGGRNVRVPRSIEHVVQTLGGLHPANPLRSLRGLLRRRPRSPRRRSPHPRPRPPSR